MAGPAANVRTIGHGAWTALPGSRLSGSSVFLSHCTPNRTPCGESQYRLSRLPELATPLVVATKFAAPGSTSAWSASTDSGARSSRPSRTRRGSMLIGTGRPRPLTMVIDACGSVVSFCHATQVTGLTDVSTKFSLPDG